MIAALRSRAKELGLAAVGVAPAIDEVRQAYPWARSVVCTAISYLPPEPPRDQFSHPVGHVARFARSADYHAVLREKLVPIARHRALIEERTGARVRQFGQMFTLNPDVSDIASRFAYTHDGVALLVLGAVEKGGGGCACPENVLLRALVSELVLCGDDALVLDMEAGIEHLGRGTAAGVDTMLVVVEPGRRSIDSTCRVLERCADIGLRDVRLVVNKVATDGDEVFVREALPGVPVCGIIPFSEEIRANERTGRPVTAGLQQSLVGRFESILHSCVA